MQTAAEYPDSQSDDGLDKQLFKAVTTNLFDDRSISFNSLFRFQIGGNMFDGEIHTTNHLGDLVDLYFTCSVNCSKETDC
jgi:hypothetical protein